MKRRQATFRIAATLLMPLAAVPLLFSAGWNGFAGMDENVLVGEDFSLSIRGRQRTLAPAAFLPAART